MPNGKTKSYTKTLKETMNRKSEILSKAQAFWKIGMKETAQLKSTSSMSSARIRDSDSN